MKKNTRGQDKEIISIVEPVQQLQHQLAHDSFEFNPLIQYGYSKCT
jgi:hypothetical protein